MSETFMELLEDERREGYAEGEKAGEKRAEECLIQNLMKNQHITAEEAAAFLKIRTEYISDISVKKAVRRRNRRSR